MLPIFSDVNKNTYFLDTVDYFHKLLTQHGGEQTDLIMGTLMERLRKLNISVITDIVTCSTTAVMTSLSIDTNVGKFILILSYSSDIVRALLMNVSGVLIDTLFEIYLEPKTKSGDETIPVMDEEPVVNPIGEGGDGGS